MPQLLQAWAGSLHQTFRLLPQPSPHLRPFLEADGLTPDEVLQRLPYATARSRRPSQTGPDPRRYRDCKHVYQTVGLLHEGADDRVHVTDLGKATLRWLEVINDKNFVILARHTAYALAACQLSNPTGAGRRYDPSLRVFPFAFIWRAMLALGGKIGSDELNRAIFKVKNEEDLVDAIEKITGARDQNNPQLMGDETVTGKSKNDRIIPWMSLASFGWTLISDKTGAGESGYYEIPPQTVDVVKEASRVRHKHREFGSVQEYVEYISTAAALPRDLR